MKEKRTFLDVLKDILEYVVWFAAVYIAVQLLTSFVGVCSIVDGQSMEPTLHHGEYLWVDKLDYQFHDPERYDVVVFPVHYQGTMQHFIKRVIGLPGETVYIDEAGTIFIDDEALPDLYGKEVIAEYNRHLAEQPITLGEDEYFVLGDNRNHSSDSRLSTVGNISKDRILGKAVFRLWPLNKIGTVK